jgi:hypothetical protein
MLFFCKFKKKPKLQAKNPKSIKSTYMNSIIHIKIGVTRHNTHGYGNKNNIKQ